MHARDEGLVRIIPLSALTLTLALALTLTPTLTYAPNSRRSHPILPQNCQHSMPSKLKPQPRCCSTFPPSLPGPAYVVGVMVMLTLPTWARICSRGYGYAVHTPDPPYLGPQDALRIHNVTLTPTVNVANPNHSHNPTTIAITVTLILTLILTLTLTLILATSLALPPP